MHVTWVGSDSLKGEVASLISQNLEFKTAF